jgi:hypothetical protein
MTPRFLRIVVRSRRIADFSDPVQVQLIEVLKYETDEKCVIRVPGVSDDRDRHDDAGFDHRFGHLGLRILNLMTFCSGRRLARAGLSAEESRTAHCERRVAWRLIFYQSAALRRYSKLIS